MDVFDQDNSARRPPPRALAFLCAWAFVCITQVGITQNVAAFDEPRIALVIGNGDYQSAPLKNPVNDATDVKNALQRVGFDVTLETNADERTMVRAIRDFGNKLRDNRGAGLFYFAGHGMQVNGENFLLPIGADILEEDEIAFESINVSRVLEKIDRAGSRVNVIILDACRNNPFERSFRSASRGLAVMESPSGTLIAFATNPGAVALDGDGRNGVYTQELLKHIGTPGLDIGLMFRRVRSGVRNATGNSQTPWETSSLTGDFFFVPGQRPPSQVVIQTPQRPAPASPARMTNGAGNSVELAYWRSIEDSDEPAFYESYLNKYPDGNFVDLARIKLDQLTPKSKPAPPEPAPARPTANPVTAVASAVTGSLTSILAAAQKKEDALQLTSPPGNNAYEDYARVLQMDPSNPQAEQGLQRIVRTYLRWADGALSEQEYVKAERYVARAAMVAPRDPSVESLQKRLAATNVAAKTAPARAAVDLGQARPFTPGSALIALPADGEYGDKPYQGSGRKTAQAISDALRRYLKETSIARRTMSRSQSIEAARHQGMEYLVFPRIEHWEDRNTLWSGKKDRVEISVEVVRARSGETVISELIDLANRWGIKSTRPEDMLPEAMDQFFAEVSSRLR